MNSERKKGPLSSRKRDRDLQTLNPERSNPELSLPLAILPSFRLFSKQSGIEASSERMQSITIFWFRRDLRIKDNAGLFQALQSGKPVLPIFIFDTEILEELPPSDARVSFIHQQISELARQLEAYGSSLIVRKGTPVEVWEALCAEYEIAEIYANQDYEPYANARDAAVEALINQKGGTFHQVKDQVIFEKNEILTLAGKPYTVFTPYGKKWRATLSESHLMPFDIAPFTHHFFPIPPQPIPSLVELGFEENHIPFPSASAEEEVIRHYHERRDFPALEGTSRLGIHLRFGTISIRQLVKKALSLNTTFLNELIWREFYMQILWNFPQVVDSPFKPAYGRIPWRNVEADFEKWKNGQTGFPLVDAGMRQLNATGFMHNRLRMLTASFLTKHLLVNWQWGEAYFAKKLLDFELSSNNGGWQWAAGCGTDAAPYFRIFNPESQLKKFDPKGIFVRKWVPEYGTPAYPAPMVDHKAARERCLAVYKAALAEK